MRTVEYPKSLQWVGEMRCSHCDKTTPAWRAGGMSDSFPHFYCNRCSNVIRRRADQAVVWSERSQEVLDRIAATLPDCPCGGRFTPGANPKCVHCGAEFEHQDDPVTRLGDRFLIAVDGACVFSDTDEPYRVKIVDG